MQMQASIDPLYRETSYGEGKYKKKSHMEDRKWQKDTRVQG